MVLLRYYYESEMWDLKVIHIVSFTCMFPVVRDNTAFVLQ